MIEFSTLIIVYLFILIFYAGFLVGKKTIEKPADKSNKTDFEKMHEIVKIYRSIDFNKLRPDQVDLWNEWMDGNL